MSVLTRKAAVGIDAILKKTQREGRSSLFEHEVYGILSCVGLDVPKFQFVRDPLEVTQAGLRALGSPVVVKIVSTGVPHKQKLGGVRVVNAADPLSVREALFRVRDEVWSHFAADACPPVEGFLLVEHVTHAQDLGSEMLMGFREDPAFGPALTVSKGGDDAEFFARHYALPDIFLPPIDEEQALALMRALRIGRRFEQVGHPEFPAMMAHVLAAFSALSVAYSPRAARSSRTITSLEVNPFAFSADGRFVALDGFAEVGAAPPQDGWNPRVNTGNLEAFFRPQGVAVVGVSADLAKYSMARDIAVLLHGLHREDLYLVNPREGALRLGSRDYPLYPDIPSLPAPVDLAVYAAPARNAPAFLRSLAGTGVRAVVLIPGVPRSLPYEDFVRELRGSVPPGVRIIGPNCMGVYHAASDGAPGVNTLFINAERLEVTSTDNANAVLLTQSGALAVTLIDQLRSCRPLRSVVSFGNKVDVKVGDLVAHFSRDPAVRVLAVYLEGLDAGEGKAFFECARESAAPIIACKGGRTEAGARAAASHTAAISGSDEVFRAACRQAGVILSQTTGELGDLIRVFSLLDGRRPRGSRVAGVVNAGFESTIAADSLSGLTPARLEPRTVELLNTINGSGLVDTCSPFLDVTPMADDRMYAQSVETVIRDEGVDCVFLGVVPHAPALKTVPETCRDQDALAALLVDIFRRHRKPVVVSVNAGPLYADFKSALEEGGFPVYADVRSAVASLDTFVSWHMGRKMPGGRHER
jgi:3-hydroxypropionyl-CoA synthetase (ADP-forming)